MSGTTTNRATNRATIRTTWKPHCWTSSLSNATTWENASTIAMRSATSLNSSVTRLTDPSTTPESM